MALSHILLHWYDQHRRHLPWRTESADPYRTWLSEVMLQQTTVAAVIPYFLDFTRRWPTVEDLAAAPIEQIMVAWAGLGYYARARNLHACARTVAALGGRFPHTEAELLKLPGIGPYTAAAIAAIAFDRPAVVMDGNVERVMARMYAVATPLPAAKPHLKHLAAGLTPDHRPGDYAQAVMDLGATICTPRSPSCDLCPWASHCQAFALNTAAYFPVKAAALAKPTRYGTAFWIVDQHRNVLLRRRPPRGLLGGMMEIPSTPWQENRPQDNTPPTPMTDLRTMGTVHHTFTHFHLELAVIKGFGVHDPTLGQWCPVDLLHTQALPTVMKKIVRLALNGSDRLDI